MKKLYYTKATDNNVIAVYDGNDYEIYFLMPSTQIVKYICITEEVPAGFLPATDEEVKCIESVFSIYQEV